MQIFLADPSEDREIVPQPCTLSLQSVVMHLTNAIVFPCPFVNGIADGGMVSAHLRKVIMATPLVGVDHRPFKARITDHLFQRHTIESGSKVQSCLSTLTPNCTVHRRTIGVPVAVAPSFIDSPPRWVIDDAMR
jgi:hypothetical protein